MAGLRLAGLWGFLVFLVDGTDMVGLTLAGFTGGFGVFIGKETAVVCMAECFRIRRAGSDFLGG